MKMAIPCTKSGRYAWKSGRNGLISGRMYAGCVKHKPNKSKLSDKL